MLIHEQIQEYVQRLPAPFQAEVLDFVEYLIAKAEHEAFLEEDQDWKDFSLASAMRGMEDEDSPYALSDLKVVF